MARRKRPLQKPPNKGRAWIVLFVLVVAVVGYAKWGHTSIEYDRVPAHIVSVSIVDKMDTFFNQAKENISAIFKRNSVQSIEMISPESDEKKVLQEASDKSDENSSFLDKIFSRTENTKAGIKQQLSTEDTHKNALKEMGNTVDKEKSLPSQRVGQARMAIILDDFGYGYKNIHRFNAIPIPLTYAILPYKPYSVDVANAGANAGKEIMVHLPMESISNATPEKITIRTTMSDSEIHAITNKAIASIPHTVGINNHQGSKATADRRVVGDILDIVGTQGLFFFDSRTTTRSVVFSMARDRGVPTGVNDLFLDNDNSVNAIESRLQQAANMAFKSPNKYVIVIGHDRPNTATAIANMYKKLEAQGITFVFVRSLLY